MKLVPSRLALFIALLGGLSSTQAQNTEKTVAPAGDQKVYGEWRIRIKPDKGAQYDELIENDGLPLFQGAGGRMVGWWKTLIGDLYEHVTVWEYDDMAAFESAVGSLGPDPKFAQFVAKRDPLLAGEESRFLRLADGAVPPTLAEAAPFVIHEVHRVPMARQADYLAFMNKQGLKLLEKHGFRLAGPFLTEVGRWTEVTYLFRFKSLAERQRLKAAFGAHADFAIYGGAIAKLVDEITTLLLMPAPFALPHEGKESATAGGGTSRRTGTPDTIHSDILPHLEQLSPGVFAAGFADRHRSANCGWVALADHTLLVDLPRGIGIPEYLNEVARTTSKPPRRLVLLRVEPNDAAMVGTLIEHGIQEVLTTAAIRDFLVGELDTLAGAVRAVDEGPIGSESQAAVLFPLDGIAGEPARGAAALHVPRAGVLFGGPLVVNGPRAKLPGSDTEKWTEALERLEGLQAAQVVPGFGSWSTGDAVSRLRRRLEEIRRQVGYVVAQGRSVEMLNDEVIIPTEMLAWMPYDIPTIEDLAHVYGELSIPIAPFGDAPPQPAAGQPHALVLYADQPHEPGHIVEGLKPVFEACDVTAHFTVDVRALTAENLARVQLLVVLRDGLQRPTLDDKQNYIWMTSEQEAAVVDFVERGGAFLNLHNSMGLYPADGPYLNLVGGRYIGHGPLERFRVEVVDHDHPITQGVVNFSVADEQHTPPYDSDKVHLLLENRSDDGQVAAAGWVYEPGRGRLCHLANGHTRESLLHPQYQLLLRNAVAWCLRRT